MTYIPRFWRLCWLTTFNTGLPQNYSVIKFQDNSRIVSCFFMDVKMRWKPCTLVLIWKFKDFSRIGPESNDLRIFQGYSNPVQEPTGERDLNRQICCHCCTIECNSRNQRQRHMCYFGILVQEVQINSLVFRIRVYKKRVILITTT